MISLIVPCSGRAIQIQRLCDSVLKQDIGEEYEVFVICNPPSAKVKKILSFYPSSFKYLESKIRGANTARNIGVDNSLGRYLFFFDDDCTLLQPNFLSENTKLLDQNLDLIACGGGYSPLDPAMNAVGLAYYFIQRKWLDEGQLENGSHRYLIGGNMTVRKTAFLEFGKFNENMKFGGTETEFFRRIDGRKILFLPSRLVSHDYKISLWSFLRKAFMQGLGSAFIEAKFGKLEHSKRVYGQYAYFKRLNILNPPLRTLYWYRLSFEAGSQFYKKSSSSKPKTRTILWEIIKYSLLKKKPVASYLDRQIRIVGNFRTRLNTNH